MVTRWYLALMLIPLVIGCVSDPMDDITQRACDHVPSDQYFATINGLAPFVAEYRDTEEGRGFIWLGDVTQLEQTTLWPALDERCPAVVDRLVEGPTETELKALATDLLAAHDDLRAFGTVAREMTLDQYLRTHDAPLLDVELLIERFQHSSGLGVLPSESVDTLEDLVAWSGSMQIVLPDEDQERLFEYEGAIGALKSSWRGLAVVIERYRNGLEDRSRLEEWMDQISTEENAAEHAREVYLAG